MLSNSTIRIGSRVIGHGHPVFLIAEAGVNHNGDLRLAKQLIDVAKNSGADAIKFQTFRAEELVSAGAPKARYQVQTTGAEESQFDMIKRLELSEDAHRELVAHCHSQGSSLSTPFDFESADLLDSLGVPAFKISSGEITNWPFLEYIASKKKPVIISTGMSDLGEVEQAVNVLRGAGCSELVILHCTSSYPAPPESVNLRAMQAMADAFRCPLDSPITPRAWRRLSPPRQWEPA